jgi:hypothetical protein
MLKRVVARPVRAAWRRLWPTKPGPISDVLRRAGVRSPVPPPPAFKHRVILGYGSGIDNFVETGTYRGGTVDAVKTKFRSVVSIELSHDLAAAAQARFASTGNVRIIQGDSGHVLPQLLPELPGTCLFWLDGHWSGGETALGESETPLLAELEAVLARGERDVILVDDARLLGTRGYPSVATIRELVARASPPRSSPIADDIMRITPQA